MKAALPFWTAIVLTALLWAPGASAQRVIYVDTDATGANDGSSWANAFVFLQDALAVAQDGDEVWVAKGVYRPDRGLHVISRDREASFRIPDGVSVFGGFLGVEEARRDRDTSLYKSVLDGDLLGNDAGPVSYDNPLRQDNALHVVQMGRVGRGTRLDGVTISGGMANRTGFSYGGAVFIHLDPIEGELPIVIHDCRLTDNYSVIGNIAIDARRSTKVPSVIVSSTTIEANAASTAAGLWISSATTLLSRVRIVGNVATQWSAISAALATVYVDGSTIAYNVASAWGTAEFGDNGVGALVMWNTAFVGNSSLRSGPGGIGLYEIAMVSINNVFSGNTSQDSGGALDVSGSSAWIINNVFAYNFAVNNGGAIYTNTSVTHIANSIFYENGTSSPNDMYSSRYRDTLHVRNSLLGADLPTEAIDGGGILRLDPRFVDADGLDDVRGSIDDDFRLLIGSPAIDAGANEALHPDILDVDRDDNVDETWPSDFSGNTRIFDGGTGGHQVDMGVFEFNAPPVGTYLFDVPDADLLPMLVMDVWPVPAVDEVTLRWNAPWLKYARLQCFDLTGRFVAELYRGELDKGQEVPVHISDLAPGPYVIREYATGQSVVILKAK